MVLIRFYFVFGFIFSCLIAMPILSVDPGKKMFGDESTEIFIVWMSFLCSPKCIESLRSFSSSSEIQTAV